MARPPFGFRPRLECLEDRTTPAATFNVTTTLDVVDSADGKLSLREAITAANSNNRGDVIVLPAGVFKIALSGTDEDGNQTGDFDTTDGSGTTIRGAGAGKTFIDGQQLDRVFDAHSPNLLVLEKLTVRNGNVTGSGGGIQAANSSVWLFDCAVIGNRASLNGGGIYHNSESGFVKLIRSTVARNVVGGGGGGIVAWSLIAKDSVVRRNVAAADVGGGAFAFIATLTRCTVSGNSAAGFGGGFGASKATLTNCTVSGNSSGQNGGGISAPTLNMINCTVSGNSAASYGGGISSTDLVLNGCTVGDNSAVEEGGGITALNSDLFRCTISGNSSGKSGGGIYSVNASLGSCTVSGNSAVTDGGGIRALDAILFSSTVSGNSASVGGGVWTKLGVLRYCTIVENVATTGGGLFHEPGELFTVQNSIVAQNLIRFGGVGPDVFGDFTTDGHNLIGDGAGSTGFTNGDQGDLVGTAIDPIDPRLGTLANNGGKTMTHALLAGSPAIDAGENVSADGTDQRGLPRKKDGNGDGVARVDIGAFEK